MLFVRGQNLYDWYPAIEANGGTGGYWGHSYLDNITIYYASGFLTQAMGIPIFIDIEQMTMRESEYEIEFSSVHPSWRKNNFHLTNPPKFRYQFKAVFKKKNNRWSLHKLKRKKTGVYIPRVGEEEPSYDIEHHKELWGE